MKLLDEYRAHHQHPVNQLIHFFCIPAIVASLVVVFFHPWVGAAMFAGGWILQFVGHGVFEKKSPAFLTNVAHLLIGPLWWFTKLFSVFGTVGG